MWEGRAAKEDEWTLEGGAGWEAMPRAEGARARLEGGRERLEGVEGREKLEGVEGREGPARGRRGGRESCSSCSTHPRVRSAFQTSKQRDRRGAETSRALRASDHCGKKWRLKNFFLHFWPAAEAEESLSGSKWMQVMMIVDWWMVFISEAESMHPLLS